MNYRLLCLRQPYSPVFSAIHMFIVAKIATNFAAIGCSAERFGDKLT
jgi:hypothetical protein